MKIVTLLFGLTRVLTTNYANTILYGTVVSKSTKTYFFNILKNQEMIELREESTFEDIKYVWVGIECGCDVSILVTLCEICCLLRWECKAEALTSANR